MILHTTYIYPLIFIVIILGELGIAPLPIPFPSEATLLFAGYAASTGKANLIIVLFLTIFADAFGSILIYLIVFFLRENKIVKMLIKKAHKESSIEKVQESFQKHLALKIIAGRLLPYLRLYTSIRAGIMEVPLRLYMLYSVIASTIWCMTIVLIGMRFSTYTLAIITSLSHYLLLDIIGIVAIVCIAIFSVYKFFADKD